MGFLYKHKRTVIVVMTVICLGAIAVTANGKAKPILLQNALGYIVTPMQNFFTGASTWTVEKINFFREMNRLQEENIRLTQENADLHAENTRLELAKKENEGYVELFQLQQRYGDYPTTGAKIIAKDSTDWYDRYTINKGTSDGLATGMTVLAPGGLLGIITDCRRNHANVISIIDDLSAIAAESVHSKDFGLVKGDSSLMRQGLCRMDAINAAAKIEVGEEIVTSPLSAYYPAGILIGTIKEIIPDPSRLTKHAVIVPAVSLNHLENVLIVTRTYTPEEMPTGGAENSTVGESEEEPGESERN